MDLVIESRKTKKAIRLYTVEQSGHISEYFITSKTQHYKKGSPDPKPGYQGIDSVADQIYPVYRKWSFKGNSGPFKDRYNRDNLFYGQHVLDDYSSEFRLFTNKMAATNYSETLKNDPEYVEEVKRWHAHCNNLFDSIRWED